MCVYVYIYQMYKLKSAVFSQKNFFQKQIYSKYLPSLTIHFSHLSGNLCIPREKNSSSFEANHSSHFLHKNRSAQRARSPSTKTGDSQNVPGLVNKRDGVALPNWVSPSSFGPLLTCATVRCRGGKLACHVFSDNAAFFPADHGAIWLVVSGEH